MSRCAVNGALKDCSFEFKIVWEQAFGLVLNPCSLGTRLLVMQYKELMLLGTCSCAAKLQICIQNV